MPTQDIDVVWKLPSGDFDNAAGPPWEVLVLSRS
jgi:hypothetical protein